MKGSLRFISKFVLLFALFAILFSYAMFQGGFTSWFLFYSFLPIFLYQLGLLFYPIKNWQVTRDLSRHVVRAGDQVSVTVEIDRKIPFPLYYCICEEMFPSTLNKVDNRHEKYHYMEQPNKLFINRSIKRIVFPWFKRHIKLAYSLDHIPRGEHQLKAIRIRTGDIFGLVKKEHIFPVAEELVAYPDERPLKLTEKISSFEQGSIASYTMNLKNTNVATGIREYMPGDRFSWIDWKQTAKKNDVMTKEFEQEKSTDTLIVLDGCYFNTLNPLAFEATVEISMSLMETIRQQASQVGFLSIGRDVTFFPAQHDPTKKDGIRRHLTRINPTRTKAFASRLKEEMFKIPNDFFVIIVTTRVDEPLKDTIKQIKLRKKQVALIVVQSKERIAENEHRMMKQLQHEGIGITVLTEKDLLKNPIGVSGL